MDLFNFLMDISAELVAGVVIFVLGFIMAKGVRSIEKYRLRRFFGDAILRDDCCLVYGVLTKIISEGGEEKLYEKKYRDGRIRRIPLFTRIVAGSTIRAVSYIVQELAGFRNTPFPICTDEEAFKDLDNTFICIGGPITNELTEWAINETSNKFLKFSIPDILYDKPVTIDVIPGSENGLSFESTQGKDYGMILKIRNSRFPNQFFFVCAGIGTWAALGATWFLSEHWKSLYKKFGNQEFGIVLEVNKGVVTSAAQVHP